MVRKLLLTILMAVLGCTPGTGTPQIGGQAPFGPGGRAPRLIHRVEPEYTHEACLASAEGAVVLYAMVKSDGSVGKVRVIRSVGFGLDESAMDTVRQWRFIPGSKDGKPADIPASIEIRFGPPGSSICRLAAEVYGMDTRWLTEEMAIPRLADRRVAVKIGAAEFLGRKGSSAAAEKALWNTFEEWHNQCAGRTASMDEENQRLEITLATALLKLPRPGIDHSKAGRVRGLCHSDVCRTRVDQLLEPDPAPPPGYPRVPSPTP